jgi:negative regulator of sigma E activity
MQRRNAVLAAAILAATTTVAGASVAGSGESPDALVADAIAAPAHVSYAGTVEVVKIGAHGAESSIFRIEHRAPDRTRKTFSAPASVDGDGVLLLGKRSYEIDVKRARVVAGENDALGDPTALAANYRLLRRNYHAVAKPDETFAGRSTRVVALVSDYAGGTMLVVRIDRRTKLVLDKQEFAANGTMVAEMRFLRVSYGGSMPDADFAVPTQYPQVDGAKRGVPSEAIGSLVAKAGFAARHPASLPLGFAAVEGSLETIQGARTLHLLYSDGVRTISLFESSAGPSVDLSRYDAQPTTVASAAARYAEAGPTTILLWPVAGITYALVGEMPLADLQQIAASIAP